MVGRSAWRRRRLSWWQRRHEAWVANIDKRVIAELSARQLERRGSIGQRLVDRPAIDVELQAQQALRHLDLDAPRQRHAIDGVIFVPAVAGRRDELPALVRDWEPATALFADGDGMAVIEGLVPQAGMSLRPGGLLVMEVDSRRADRAADVVKADGRFADIEIRMDLTGRPRFVAARRKER